MTGTIRITRKRQADGHLVRRTDRGRAGGGAAVLLAALFAASPASAQQKLSGMVRLDGSSTVAPITMAAAEMFMAEHPRVRVVVGISGTGGGFKKFLDENPKLRTHINDASRPIREKERERARRLGIEYIEIPIGIDGLSVVVNPSNTFCNELSVEELRRIWEPGSRINNWSQIRPGFPDLPLHLYGPGTDSGTFDYFTKVIVGKEHTSRSDYTASESDNVLVRGVAGDQGALGYFGFAYYVANKKRLKILGIRQGNAAPVKPTMETVRSGKYKPLSRPLFLYVNKEAYKLPQVRAFLAFLLDHARSIVEHPRVGYVALSDELYEIGRRRLREGKTGSAMAKAGDEHDLVKIFTRY
ncbi:MAG: PstS family phosphate ABC transporter substrate-binding protein [Planctomycetota bacterium]|nr:MAG: PstS family phosphate ABC transporter substrate-binding protein [Planctomycetota bacterium]